MVSVPSNRSVYWSVRKARDRSMLLFVGCRAVNLLVSIAVQLWRSLLRVANWTDSDVPKRPCVKE